MEVYANGIIEHHGMLKVYFPFRKPYCAAGNCKCAVAEEFCNAPPVVLIGDGGSDFCLAGKADIVFAKGRLAAHCTQNKIPHYKFTAFSEISGVLARLHLINEQSTRGGMAI